eukprot:TRINITY_DN8154_c0_g1_i1.p1 TRINITY_DN8154_c0_g1~~TRINITY_DN8154_c0_g1_i1.p1  ORF type:complete len:350 (+),score=101.95 TRINITY_DN8154_c0_g1_i1:74-1051(+)
MGSDDAPLAAKEEPEAEKPKRKPATDVAPKDEEADEKPRIRHTEAKAEESKGIVPKTQKKEDPDEESDEDDDELLPEVQPSFDRNEVDAGDEKKFRQEAVHVYGLDFLKSEHMNEIFGQFNHKYIEWINDSCANIVFKTSSNAKKALESLSYPKVGDQPWRRTPDILVNEDSPPVFLQMRLATAADVKKGKKAVPTVMAGDRRRVGRRGRRIVGVPGRTYRDGMTTELLEEAGLIGSKRKVQAPPTDDEVQKRRKREERFGKSQAPEADGAADNLEAEAAKAARQSAEVVKGNGIAPTSEELERRKKREERFSKSAEAQAASTST